MEMDLNAVIECVWRSRSSELRDSFGGHDRSELEKYLEAVDLESIWRQPILKGVKLEGVHLEAVGREACAMEAESLFIG
jgi:hypothetical protein